MANHETTFGSLEIDERFKKLQRSLKLAILKQERNKNDGKTSSVTTWPSISSINGVDTNGDTLDSSCTVPSLQNSLIKSEVVASSNNLRNILLKKNNRSNKQEEMATSSVKQYNIQQNNPIDQLVMPPPTGNIVYRTFKEPPSRIRTLSNCEKAVSTSLNRSAQSSTLNTFSSKNAPTWISTNTNADKEYSKNTFVTPTTSTDCQKVRIFSKWKVMLNDQYELIIKGTLECGRIARSKPVIRRYSATCVESKYKHKYFLQGNIIDERNGLPDYIRGKFYNGFPDDWENVYQIWRTYVSQGCPVIFRWPTPITDSDDDLKSEITDLTHVCVKNKKLIPPTESRNLKYTKTENLTNLTFEKKEKYHNYSTHSSQNYEKDVSFISNSEKDVIPVVQTKNIKSLCDESNKQIVKMDTNPQSNCMKDNKLKDILQEDKLNIIIKNLADRNCSPKYIDKIIEMFDCLDYIVSYRTESECNNDSMISANQETFKSKTIPLQSNLMYNDNCANTNKLENKLTQLKNYGHSTDLGYGSTRNDSNAIQLSNPANIEPQHNTDSDKSENETYGVPKISIERVLKARETSRKIHKRKIRKKTNYLDASKQALNLSNPYAEKVKSVANLIVNTTTTKKNSLPNESCVSITEDEVETMSNMRKYRNMIDITQKPQEMTFSSHKEIQKNNFDVYGRGKSVMHVQNEQPNNNAFESQRVNLNVFIKEQKIPYRNIQENTHSQFVTDIDYTTNSDINIVNAKTNTRKTDGNTIVSHANVNQDIVKISESNSDFPKRFCASSELHEDFIEQTRNEITMKKFKPTIINSMPVNLNLKINKVNLKAGQPYDSKIMVKDKDKQDNIRSLEENDRKSMLKSVATKPVINDSHSKTTIETVDNKRKICPIINNKNESNNVNSINATTSPTNEFNKNKQPKNSKLGDEKTPKVLTTWTPKVVYYPESKSKLGLTFQGKLLNEAGHVVHRKFTTDIVARRLSSTLIETVTHEFYELLGHLNDNKHTLPKELERQCRNGCPAKIEQFCLIWKTLQHDNVQEIKEKFHDATMDSLNAPVSSRGRRILPPLSYWTGERITMKDNNPVYRPGNSKESSLLSSLTDNSKEIQKDAMDTEEKKKQKINSEKNISEKQNVNKQMLPEPNKTSSTNKNQTQASSKSPKTKIANVKSDNSKKSGKSINKKRRVVQKLTFSSTDSSEEEQKGSLRKYVRDSQINENVNSVAPHTMTLRKRQKMETSSAKTLRFRDTTKSRYCTSYNSPTKRNPEMTYSYYQNIKQPEDFLSENEESSI